MHLAPKLLDIHTQDLLAPLLLSPPPWPLGPGRTRPGQETQPSPLQEGGHNLCCRASPEGIQAQEECWPWPWCPGCPAPASHQTSGQSQAWEAVCSEWSGRGAHNLGLLDPPWGSPPYPDQGLSARVGAWQRQLSPGSHSARSGGGAGEAVQGGHQVTGDNRR